MNKCLLSFDTIIENMQLQDVLDSKINIISGGERKRTMDLILNRKVIRIDELTSDLDTHLAYKITKFLRDLAIKNDLILIMSFHHPSSQLFALFDTLAFFHRGHCIYTGPTFGIEEFLASKGLKRSQDITIQEYIFELFSKSSSFESIEELRSQVNNLMSKLDAESGKPKASLSNDTTYYDFGVPNLSHIWSLLKRQITVSHNYGWYIRMILYFIFSVGLLDLSLPIIPEKNQLDANMISVILQKDYLPYIIADYLSGSLAIGIMLSPSALILENTIQFKTEIQKKYYSIASFYIFIIVYEIFFNTVFVILRFITISIMAGLQYISLFNLFVSVLLILFYSIYFHFYIIVGFLGNNKPLFKLAIGTIGFMVIPTGFWPNIKALFNLSIEGNIVCKILYYLYLVIFTFLSSYNVLLDLLIEKYHGKDYASIELKESIGYKLSISKIISVVMLSNLLLIFLGIVILRFAITFRLRLQHKNN